MEKMNKLGMKRRERMLQSNPKVKVVISVLLLSDLPCMHLDPGVNRLGLNITSVHQTDRRPVTPDIVFPICVILWPQEDGLKEKHSKTKRGQYISQIRSRTHTVHMRPGSEKPVLVPCLKEAWKEVRVITKQHNETCK